MKRALQKQILATDQSVRAWNSISRNDLHMTSEGFRPSFLVHRLACTIAELEELLAVHQSLWPHDLTWREDYYESLSNIISPSDVLQFGSVVAEEERPNPVLANSQDIRELFEFFCQIRKSILYSSSTSGEFDAFYGIREAVNTSMESIKRLNRSKRVVFERVLTSFLNNSFLSSNIQIKDGQLLSERYWPLFKALHLLRGESVVKNEKIQDILKETNIKPETQDRVGKLIDDLQRVHSDYDINQIQDILASGGRLFPGMGQDGSIVVIPRDSPGHCAPIILAIAKGRDRRSRFGLPNVMREIRAHLIHCFEIAEVVVLLTDQWDPQVMKESENDFSAYSSRSIGQKVLIPLVSWKRQFTPYIWP